jgi:hypothetical protein
MSGYFWGEAAGDYFFIGDSFCTDFLADDFLGETLVSFSLGEYLGFLGETDDLLDSLVSFLKPLGGTYSLTGVLV